MGTANKRSINSQFLGLDFDGFCHRFTVQFSTLSGPPSALTGKSAPKFQSEQCEEGVLELKQRLVSVPVLTLPTEYVRYIVQTCASRKRMGCVIVRQGKVVAQTSKQSKDHENNCPTHDLEFAAPLQAMDIFGGIISVASSVQFIPIIRVSDKNSRVSI